MKKKISVKILNECFLGTLIASSLFQTLYGLIYPENAIELIGLSFASLLFLPAFAVGRFLKNQPIRLFPYFSLSLLASAPYLLLWFISPLAGISSAILVLIMILTHYRSEENLTPIWVEEPHILWGILFVFAYIGAIFRENETFKLVLCIDLILFFSCYLISKNLSQLKDVEELGKETPGFSRKKMLILNRKIIGLILLLIVLLGTAGIFLGQIANLPDIRNFSFSLDSVPPQAPEESPLQPDSAMPNLQELLGVEENEPGWLAKLFQFLADLFMRLVRLITWQHIITVLGIVLIIGMISGFLTMKFRTSKEAAAAILESDSKTISVDRKNKKANHIRFLDFSPSAVVRRRFRRIILKYNKTPLQSHTPEELVNHTTISENKFDLDQLKAIYEKARYSENGCEKSDLENF